MPRGPDVLAYRHLAFGKLADLAVLDTRQYRSKQPCGDGIKANCAEAAEPRRTTLGERGRGGLAELLRSGSGTWQVLAQQVMFSQFDWRSFPWSRTTEPGAGKMDAWDGALTARERLLGVIREKPASNPVVLTGDMHKGSRSRSRTTGANPARAALAWNSSPRRSLRAAMGARGW